MVATDTVVGIVGAVVLVAVMAGVFVYEYNNAPVDADDPASRMAHFEEDYAGLSANDDLDGDGIANYEDPDLDGDGLNDTVDDSLGVTVPVQGTVAASSGSAGTPLTQEFTVGNGSFHFQGTITYTRQNGAVAVPSLQATIAGPNGFSLTASSAVSGNTVTLSFDLAEPLEAGDYTLRVSHSPVGGVLNAAPATPVAGSLEIHYETPAEPHGHTTPEK